MISNRIIDYLKRNGVSFGRRWHPRAIAAQQVAASIHVSGHRVAKAILVAADQQRYLAVLPAAELIDPERLSTLLGARQTRLLQESEFAELFPDCELGAEPPFGGLYGLPVVMDRSLASAETIVFRAGSHEETIEMKFGDFERLERPKMGSFIVQREAVGYPTGEARPTI